MLLGVLRLDPSVIVGLSGRYSIIAAITQQLRDQLTELFVSSPVVCELRELLEMHNLQLDTLARGRNRKSIYVRL